MDLRDDQIDWLARTTELHWQEPLITTIYDWRGHQFTAAAQVLGAGSITALVGALAAFIAGKGDPVIQVLAGALALIGIVIMVAGMFVARQANQNSEDYFTAMRVYNLALIDRRRRPVE